MNSVNLKPNSNEDEDFEDGGGDLLGLDFVLQSMLEERDPRMHGATLWQATLGRLAALEVILKNLRPKFQVREGCQELLLLWRMLFLPALIAVSWLL